MKRLLLAHAEGIGNLIELLPCVATIEKNTDYKVDIFFVWKSYLFPSEFLPKTRFYTKGIFQPTDYDGSAVTQWGNVHLEDKRNLKEKIMFSQIKPLCDLGKQSTLRGIHSEVGRYLEIAKALKIPSANYVYDVGDYIGFDLDYSESFDVVLCDGYNRKNKFAKWHVKSYPKYPELANLLKKEGYSVCSIGMKPEYIEGTEDRTDIGMLKTASLIRNARLIISNDTGWYHVAAAFKKPGIVLFTCTLLSKNYDPKFHKTITSIGMPLSCRASCQPAQKWRIACKHWNCRNIDLQQIFKMAMAKLKKQEVVDVS